MRQGTRESGPHHVMVTEAKRGQQVELSELSGQCYRTLTAARKARRKLGGAIVRASDGMVVSPGENR